MKRKRQSWATRPLPPITSERIEQYLDFLAEVMARAGRNAELFLPIWKRLELELEKRREVEAMLAAAKDRLSKMKDCSVADHFKTGIAGKLALDSHDICETNARK